MEKKEAARLIENTFGQRFDLSTYTHFIKNFLNDYDEEKEKDWSQGKYVYEAFRDHIQRFKRLGVYTDPDGHEMELLVIEVKSATKLERARTSLRNFVIKRLHEKERDYALCAFYSAEDNGADWRFSFVKIDLESYKDDKGKVKTKKELSPAKRYSFLVGEYEKSHTAKNQLLPILQSTYGLPSVDAIEKGFSIEKVTDEFFEQYKELYIKLSEHIDGNKKIQKVFQEAETDTPRFTKKLLGQIVFLYFLQKKGWLGVAKKDNWGQGDKRFIQELYNDAIKEDKNFFDDYLKYLFYEALAKARSKSVDPAYYKRFDCKIPFLNGGLFEAEYAWDTIDLKIPNDFFRKDEKNKAGDVGTGILDVFDRYNFTIKEDEPLEKEVAVDPEMLGKVFENMLEIKERKSKGAFYTPREIVHYMCQESLIQFLDNALNAGATVYQPLGDSQLAIFLGSNSKKGQPYLEVEHSPIIVPKKDIEDFIHYGYLAIENDQNVIAKGKETSTYKYVLPESIRLHADVIDTRLTHIKICDPAIGSGAFPVGLLHELMTAQKVLHEHLTTKYLDKKLSEIGLDKSEYKKDKDKYYYRIKRHAIQESIYGVDIDASAIDIARLRLWLSLIVDEDDFYNIEALPNLDYKLVKGNSLIGLSGIGADKYPQLCNELEKLKIEFFNETNELTKKKLREKINTKIDEVLEKENETYDNIDLKINFDYKLFFSEIWHYNNGFDIVIGNPPYGVSLKGNTRKLISFLFDKVPDFEIYYYFIELSHKILKKGGINSYIIPNSILFNVFAEGYRVKILNKWQINEILDCTNFKFFEKAVVRNIIYCWSKDLLDKQNYIGYRNTFESQNFIDLISRPKILISKLELLEFRQNWGLAFKLNPKTIRVIERIRNQEKKVNDLFEISQGYIPYRRSDLIKTYGKNKGNSIIDNREWHSNERLNNEYIEEIHGRNLTKYKYTKAESFVWYGKHLAGYIEPKYFNRKRILVREITNPTIIGCIVEEHLVNDPQIISIVNKENSDFSLEWLWCILNSRLATFYHFNASPKATKGDFPKILVTDIRNFPLPSYNPEFIKTLIILRNYCVFSSSKNEFIERYFFELINAIVFEFYFSEELKLAGKEILKHLKDLKPITDNIGEEKKLSIIQAEFERLYDPNHAVRNIVETLDSVEEVRVIREALRK